ncbi:MAG: Gfo/Idh/MocA family oxidoreductase [Alphaproteobacteria bacterium]|nr:Gfo/Idh/MocA family oxidoreductase [Alphaproteobacteria bacterium]
MTYGFGIIGTGTIGPFHARAIQTLDNARFVGAYDANADSLTAFGKDFPGKLYSDLQSMVDDPEISIVTICTPSALHVEPALAAIAAGKHVIIEKPLDVTLERCDQIIEAAEKKGVVAACVFQNRFIRGAKILKEAVDEDRFGRLVLGDAYIKWFRSQDYYDGRAARGTLALDGGGALMSQAIHAIDLLQWYMGPVDSVYAYADTLGHERLDFEDVSVAVLRFASGAMGVIEGSTAVYPGFFKKIEISGVGGSAVLEEESITTWSFAEESDKDEAIREEFRDQGDSGGGAADPTAIDFRLHAAQFRNLMEHLDGKAELLVDAREARKAVEIILAIYESADTGKPVQIKG